MHPDNGIGCNAEDEVADPDSVFHYWASVLRARKKLQEVLIYGDLKLLDREHPRIFVYERKSGNERVMVACNFTQEEARWSLENLKCVAAVILSTHDRTREYFGGKEIVLEPFEAWALLL